MTELESNHPRMDRRRFLAGLGVIGGGAAVLALGVPAPATAAPAQPGNRATRWSAAKSQNGWPVLTGKAAASSIKPHRVQGSDASVALRTGDVATVLLHVARRFHYEVDQLRGEEIQGHTADRMVAAPLESNYLSGTAISIRPGQYPLGAAGCLFPHEVVIVRDVLADCEGVVRWGGDDRNAPKEGHFQIDVKPGDGALPRLAARINGWAAVPGQGAGLPVDPFATSRRAAADALAARQRGTA